LTPLDDLPSAALDDSGTFRVVAVLGGAHDVSGDVIAIVLDNEPWRLIRLGDLLDLLRRFPEDAIQFVPIRHGSSNSSK
jgi:hypothetical protein